MIKIKERERVYELNYILTPQIEEEKIKEIENKIREIVTSLGGEIINIETIGKKRLAYKILNNKEGIYILVTAKTKHSALKSVDEYLRVREDVLRYLAIRKET